MSDLGDQPQKPYHHESVPNRSPQSGGKPRPPLNRRQEGSSQLRTPDAQSSANGSGNARSTARRVPSDTSSGFWGRLFGRRSRQRSRESATSVLDNSGQTARLRLDRDPLKRRDTPRTPSSTSLFLDRPSGWNRARTNIPSATGLGDTQGRMGPGNPRSVGDRPTRFSAPTDNARPLRDRPRPFTVLQSNETKLQTELGSTSAPSLQNRREARRQRRMSVVDNRMSAADKAAPVGRSPSHLRENLPPRRPRSPGVSAVLYATRMLILSVGVGVLAGTALSVWDPASRAPAGASQQSAAKVAMVSSPTPELTAQLQLGQEIAPLKATLQALSNQSSNAQLMPGLFFLDMDSNAYVELNGSTAFPAASTIKVPVLVAFFQDVDAGKIRLDELLTMRQELIGSGSGEMQYLPVGSQFTALETVIKMITISDNTATNMLIARMGGMSALNQRFKSWGLTATAINNVLPDLEGTNTTSPKDMALLMARISQGELVSLRSRDRMLDIMRKTVTDSLLPRGLGAGATISHKTGDIGSLVGDVGLIDMPNGKRYTAAVLVKRPFNDSRAQELIRQISRTTYEHFSRTQAGQSSRPTSAASSSASSASPSNP